MATDGFLLSDRATTDRTPVSGRPRLKIRLTERDESLSVVVVAAVEAMGADLGPGALYEVVDPDALDAIFDSIPDGPARGAGIVSFPLAGCTVTVRGGTELEVRGPKRPRTPVRADDGV